jgi:CHAT domain-containing protein/SIR2-like protein
VTQAGGHPDVAGYADLELTLHRRDSESYAAELRFSQADSDADVRLLAGDASRVQIDLDQLRALALDDDAYGRALGAALFADGALRSAYAQARASAEAADAALRLRLFVAPTAPELQRLRWESLRDPDTGALAFTGEQVLFSRYLSSMDWRPIRLRPKGDLQALVAIANPTNIASYQLAAVDVATEADQARSALGRTRVVTLASDPRVTLERLFSSLRDGYDILYLVCHGAFAAGEPRLWLETDEGLAAVIAGDEFVGRMAELRDRPRLVVLASCQSAGATGPGATAGEALAALGPRLAEAGIPAVLAMQDKVSVQTVSRFMPVFFTELLRDGQIDRAMAVARGAVRDRPDGWIPVLFMRLKSGRIWYVPGFAGDRPGFEQWPAVLRSIRQGRCTPILGPGLLESLMGSSRDLARRWAETYGFPMAPHNRDDLAQVAQFLAVNQDPEFPRSELTDYLHGELVERYGAELAADQQHASLEELLSVVGANRQARDPAEPHHVLAELGFPLYLTTNPDPLLATTLKATGREPRVALCPWNEYVEQSLADDATEPSAEQPLVYHLFGRFDEPDSLVLTEDDYFDYLIGVTSNKDLIPEAVRRALADTALLFLGFHMDDWSFRVLFRSIMRQEGGGRRRKYAHVAVQIDPEEGRFLQPERARRYLESYFQTDDIRIYWGSVEDFVRDLLAHSTADGRTLNQPTLVAR